MTREDGNAKAHCHVVEKFVTRFIKTATLALRNVDEVSPSVWATHLMETWSSKENRQSLLKSLRNSKITRPKKVKSRYIYFCQEERPKIAEKYPHMKITEMTCQLGQRWKIFKEAQDPESLERMARLHQLFLTDKKLRDEEKRALAGMTVKQRHTPSRYLNFCAERRKLFPKITMKELGLQWAQAKRDACPEEDSPTTKKSGV